MSWITRTAVLSIASAVLASAQMMGGGMGNGPGSSTGTGSSSWSLMGSAMGAGMDGDLVIDTDGAAYAVRMIGSGSAGTTVSASTQVQYELTAISPVDGTTKWHLQIPAGRVSGPVLGPDGRIYLTADGYAMNAAGSHAGSMMGGGVAQSTQAQLVIVSHTSASASIQTTVQTTSNLLTTPKLVSDSSTGSYLIYVVGYDMMAWNLGSVSTPQPYTPGKKTLYAYRPDGSLKFSVALSQSTVTP